MKKPETFRTVKQPENTAICGACVVAMATGLDLDLVQAGMDHSTIDCHLFYEEKEIIQFLASLSVFAGMRAIPLENPIHPDQQIEFKWPLQGNPAILSVKSKIHENYDHWVFWDGEHVRDSSWINEDDTSKLQDYEIQEISALGFLLFFWVCAESLGSDGESLPLSSGVAQGGSP